MDSLAGSADGRSFHIPPFDAKAKPSLSLCFTPSELRRRGVLLREHSPLASFEALLESKFHNIAGGSGAFGFLELAQDLNFPQAARPPSSLEELPLRSPGAMLCSSRKVPVNLSPK